jgi:hypothetical protein
VRARRQKWTTRIHLGDVCGPPDRGSESARRSLDRSVRVGERFVAALLRAGDAAKDAGVAFVAREPSPALRRIVDLMRLEDLLAVE